MGKTRTGLIAALDVGSTKICCFIAHVHGDGAIRIVGVGHHASQGMKGGAIVDMEAVQHCILAAVSAAEQLAGERIREVLVNVSGSGIASHGSSVEVALGGREVGEGDLRRALAQANGWEHAPDRALLHCIPIAYRLDSTRGIRDPRGMCGSKLGIEMHLVTARAGMLRNLINCVEHCHLDIEAAVAAPYASGLACLVEDETDLGVSLVDMGGGTTTIAVFYEGEAIHTDSIPLGGHHVTSDVARGLSTPLIHAERMKTLYGSALSSPSDERELIDVPLVGEETHSQANHVPRSILVGIIRPRLEEIFEMVRSRLDAAGMDRIAGRRMVLTGGASQLQGVRELATLVLEKQVRMGRPLRFGGLAESTSGPAFATCAGLLRYAVEKQLDARDRNEPLPVGAGANPFGRLGQWIKENF